MGTEENGGRNSELMEALGRIVKNLGQMTEEEVKMFLSSENEANSLDFETDKNNV